ncbi:protein C17H12.2 [Ditylenchus destructor]|uniref:Protein C17H12.2 n=1 Tax=Ditylenchus destructor TaxID=166010 RepID=A0AAD4N7D8_9BILA|nr:protein C17H12.2 [Ditylenchus destructor]
MDRVTFQQFTRRLATVAWNGGGWPRAVPKRYAFLGCAMFCLFVYIFIFSSSSERSTANEQCVADYYARKAMDFDHLLEDKGSAAVSFVGNGFIGIDVMHDRQLLVQPTNESRNSPLFTSFRPLVEVSAGFVKSNEFIFVSDYRDGTSKAVQCSALNDKCVCISQSIYAHRTRPNILIQDIRVSNPSTSSVELKFTSRAGFANWEKSDSGQSPVYIKLFDHEGKTIIAMVCSSVPLSSVNVRPQTEETFRFICVVQEEKIQSQEAESMSKRKIIGKITDYYTQINGMNSHTLDNEHKNAWKMLNQAAFNISHSKATGALNPDKINITRYALLSNVRAPLLELAETAERRKLYEEQLAKTELCYSGHSTLLTPSKLWQDWTNVQELLKTIEIWLMTLEHRGCIHVLRAGAHGVAQAFLLSLLAGTFTHQRLELSLEPESDLHRHIRVENLRFGSNGAFLNFDFDLDGTYRPFVKLSSHATTPLYACSAGCLEPPKAISNVPVELVIKVTKPVTPILFIADTKAHLEQVKETLHVIEVIDAPPHEYEKIELHKHGENRGLPTIFWVILVLVIVAFHLFLFKLLYTEWKNSASIPYTKFNKKFLLRR